MPRRRLIAAAGLFLCASIAYAQTGGSLLPNAQQQFVDGNGVPINGGKVYTYVPATTTPKLTWQDPALTQPNTNPIILDSAGRATIWGTGSYREVVQDSAGNLIWDLQTQAPSPPVVIPTPPVNTANLGKSFTADLLGDTPMGGVAAPVIFNQIEFDTIGGYSTITGTFVPSIKGVYFMSTSIYFEGSTTSGGNCFAAIYRNGLVSRLSASVSYVDGLPAATPLGSLPVTGLFQMNGAGDNLQVKASCNANGTIVAKGGSANSYVSAIWLGSF